MIDVSGHWRSSRCDLGYGDTASPLIINCCGWQTFKTKDLFHNRLEGRLDYQLIYVYKGSGHFYLNDKWASLYTGNLVCFRPHEPQIYSYYAADNPEIYWIHFTGSEAGALMEKYGIQSGYIGKNPLLGTLFRDIITELQLKKNGYEDIILNSFYRILMTVCRCRRDQLMPSENDYTIERLILQLHQQYMDKWTIASMADYCRLSEGHFAHSFKKYTGRSPVHFLNDLRIEKAKRLLIASNMNISTIASLVGFCDPLYFSRVFKKNAGVAPQDFRKDMLQSHSPEWS